MLITPLYPPAVGGAATYFGEIAPELARRREVEQLTVLTERIPGEALQQIDGSLCLLRYLPARASLPQRRWLGHAMTYVLAQFWFAARLTTLARHHRIKLIQFHSRYRGRLFYAALRRSGVPVFADLRDKMTDPTQLVSVADRLLCCGEGVKRFAIEGGFPAERMALIPIPFTPPQIPSPEGVSHARQLHGLGEAPYLIFVGDITSNKGVYDLLKAYRRWRPVNTRIRLVFAGINRDGKKFLDAVKRTEGAKYLGHVPHSNVFALMRGAEIVVLPSRSEGLPRTILEAVALGTKVICPPRIPEFERHLPQFVLPEVNVDSLVGTLDAVWRHEGVPTYPLSEHDVGHVVEALVSHYAELLR